MRKGEHEWRRPAKITYRVHALVQMFRREISCDDILTILRRGRVVEEYPDDTPYPSMLISGMVNNRPLHVVVAYNNEEREVIVITAYEPDRAQWDREFTRRRE